MQELSLDLLKEKLKRYPHFDELERFLERIKDESPVLLVLFGSLARGDFTQHSDIDVLCVYDEEFSDPRERFLKSYKHSDGLVQTKTLSLKEFKTGLLTGNSFLYEVMRTGIILYSKISMNDLEKWIKECKKNLKVRILPPY